MQTFGSVFVSSFQIFKIIDNVSQPVLISQFPVPYNCYKNEVQETCFQLRYNSDVPVFAPDFVYVYFKSCFSNRTF